MNKKGFELSINFIVMLVLAIAVFGFGLYFAKQLFSQGEQIKAQLDKNTESDIEELLSRGETVAIPISAKTVDSGDLAIFGLGIMNVRGEQETFSVAITCTKALDRRDNDIVPDPCPAVKILPASSSVTLSNNERKVIPIAVVTKDQPIGTYLFKVQIAVGGEDYVPPRLFYVTIR